MILIMAMNHYQRLFLDFSDYEESDGRINLNSVSFSFSFTNVKLSIEALIGKLYLTLRRILSWK